MAHSLTRVIYTRALGLISLVAVGSFWWQVPGLVGARGIAPAAEYAEAVNRAGVPWAEVPSLVRLWPTDTMVHLLCALGVLASLALVACRAPRVALAVLWVSWLSLVEVCHPWLDFQWDLLLVEAALVSIPFVPGGLVPRPAEPRPGARLLMALLACKVTLGSGVVKLLAGDPSWTELTALTYHWWTQPLPTWTAVLAARAPLWIQMALCGLVFVGELPVPLLALGARTARLLSAAGIIGLQLGLVVLGNYSYFNWLTIVLAIPLLDDRALATLARRPPPSAPASAPASAWASRGLLAAAAAYGLASVVVFGARWGASWPPAVARAVAPLLALRSINAYGAFATMTKNRAEIELEGTRDGLTWEPYVFRFKPGPVDRRPGFIAPWQPRLDWQMWFASLSTCQGTPWFIRFQHRLLEGSAPVLALLERAPAGPVLAVRATSWEYRFAAPGAGPWWTRTPVGPYCPPLTLGPDGALSRFQ